MTQRNNFKTQIADIIEISVISAIFYLFSFFNDSNVTAIKIIIIPRSSAIVNENPRKRTVA
ncbi:hypothetical protein RFZ44_21415, partial [Acinetobacter sp. 163]|nr:hypothetical protein [Acinetobacter sp. 163]